MLKEIYKLFVFAVLLLFLMFPSQVLAQTPAPPKEEFRKAEVIEIIEEGEKLLGEESLTLESQGFPQSAQLYQIVKVKILEGEEEGQELIIHHGGTFAINPNQKVALGNKVVLYKSTNLEGETQYHIIDKYRIDTILILILAFFAFVLAFSRLKGFGAIIGLIFSLAVIVKFIVPQILAGKDPILISIVGSFLIMIVTIYLAHGFSKRTNVALLATFITLTASGLLAALFVNIAHLTGLGNELAYGLRFGQTGDINVKGLLLGGMIIGALGVLDDVTTTQSASVFELAKANNKLTFIELAQRGFVVGREHISSLVNTLVLAYAGVALPLFLIVVLNPSGQPLWFLLNSEAISEEVIRTLAGSFGLILAVPTTTLLAAWVAKKYS